MRPYCKPGLSVIFLPFVLSLVCSTSHAQSANASFGTVYGAGGTATAYACFSANGGYYYPNNNPDITTNAGTVSLSLGQIQPGNNCVTSTLYPNSIGGSISGSTTVDYRSEDGQPDLYVTFYTSGTSIIPTATAGLKYQVLSVLYIAPGNASTSGFSTTQSAGATTSISQDFSNTDSLTFSYGFLGQNNGVTFGSGQSFGDKSSYTTSYQATNNVQLVSNQQKMDHTQDRVFLLVDPSITVTQTGDSSGTYDIGPSLDATGNFGSGGTPADILNSNIAGFKNPSLIPVGYLTPQVVQPGTTLPGLDYICANPLPPSQCTQQNACGCTSADFAPIVPQDELANDTNDSTQPSSIDANRYVYVTYLLLQGPEQQGGAPVKTSYNVTDGNMNSETLSNGTSYSIGYSHTFGYGGTGSFNLQIVAKDTFTYSQTQTAGTSNGTAHTASVTLGTSDVGCQEYVDVYEDTTYHTFTYALSQPAPANCQ